jgi:hypothetical protein
MTQKQKIAITIGSSILGAYAVIFIYQRIQRAKADASNLPANDALEILRKKKINGDTPTPDFSSEDSIPQVPNPEMEMDTLDTGSLPDSNLTEVQKWDVISGMGDY